MSSQEISLVLGTAGHIDHGKTSLVRALTSVDCDRLSEEKQRGITIELGFAPLQLPDGRVVSIVDVPGHEKFIRQMVAGVSGIDAVIFVVAADEGVMPQTREHLDILKLLGIHRGIVAVTKTDLVDPELLELAMEDIRELLEGTFLETAPMVPVSAKEGANIDTFRDELVNLLDRIEPRESGGPLFLPVDRTFAISGFGTVVTGTAYSGDIQSGQDIAFVPAEKQGKVRGVQVHGQNVERALAGQRVAVNVTGISVDEISRGDVLCPRDLFCTTRCMDVDFALLPNAPAPLRHWQRVRLHIGTSDILARISLMGSKEIQPGQQAPAQLVTEEPVVSLFGQPFVVRFYSPLQTIGGGKVLNPYGHKPRGAKARTHYLKWLSDLSASSQTGKDRPPLILSRQTVISMKELSILTQIMPVELQRMLENHPEWGKCLGTGGNLVIAAEIREKYRERISQTLSTFHQGNPFLQGMPLDQVVQSSLSDLESRTARLLLEDMLEEGLFVQEGNRVKLPDFKCLDSEEFRKKIRKLLQFCLDREFQLPELEEIPRETGIPVEDVRILLEKLREEGKIAIVGRTFVLCQELELKLIDLLNQIEGPISLAAVRDRTSSSRKFILPVLEYFDSRGITRRVGDKRILRKHKE